MAASEMPTTRAPRNPEQRKRTIVEATARLISQEGTARLTHRRIAQEAGVPLGSTTQYFSSIDELRREGLAELARQLETEYLAMGAALDDGPDAFAATLNDYLSDVAQTRTDAKLYDAAANDPIVRELVRATSELMVESLAVRAGEARARMLVTFIDGAVVHACVYDEPFEPELVRRAVHGLLDSAATA